MENLAEDAVAVRDGGALAQAGEAEELHVVGGKTARPLGDALEELCQGAKALESKVRDVGAPHECNGVGQRESPTPSAISMIPKQPDVGTLGRDLVLAHLQVVLHDALDEDLFALQTKDAPQVEGETRVRVLQEDVVHSLAEVVPQGVRDDPDPLLDRQHVGRRPG